MMKRQNIFYRTLTAVLPILSLLAVVLLIHRRIAFTNLIIARGDTYFYFYPYWHVAAAAFRAGQIPLWNPDLFMGAPLLANSQAGFFYPFNWPLWSWLDTPYAVSATIILHVFIAACGVYYAGRRALNLSRSGAVIAAILFAVGGYLTVQVEHVNQAQGMAWLPWIIGTAANWSWTAEHWRSAIRKGALIAVFFALQLLAGHTQTTFITGIGMGIWVGVQLLRELYVWYDDWQKTPRTYPPVEKKPINPLRLIIIIGLILGIGVIVAAIIATIQLAPTLELTQLSRRQGGLDLDEALSFSLHPLLFARAMLPGYGQLPYGEYISYLPIVGIILAIIGIAQGGKNRHVWPPFVLAMVGLLFAFGEFNPLFSNVIIKLPAFDLFRVPARWLVLYALGFAFLGGIGWDQLGRISSAQEVRRAVFWGMLIVVTLMALVPVSDYFGQTSVPMPPESPAQDAIYQLWLGWFLELGCVLLFFWMVTRHSARWRWFLFVPIVISLMMGANTIQQEALTTPEAYYDIRQSVARLQVSAEAARQANQPVPRFLSMSKGTFDPGDQGEIDSIYTDQLTKEQLYRYTVTVKDREIIAPNLTMIYGLSAADGFDGGLLPLYDYAATVSLMLPEDVETIDGRLRELLVDFPPAKWLDLFGVRYLIADRISQQEHTFEGVRATFDVLQKVTLQPNELLNIGELPNYISAELWIIATGNPGKVRVSAGPSTDEWRFESIGNDVWRAKWSQPGTPDHIELIADQGEWEIHGATLVDPLNNTHSQLVLGNYATTHIGDVKVYENLDPLPRAFIVHSWQLTTTVDAAVSAMASADFDPHQQAVLQVETPKVVLDPEPVRPKPTRDKEMDEDEVKRLEEKAFEEEQKLQQERQALIEKLTIDQLKPITISVTAPSTATITSYAPEKIEIQTNSSADGLLVLTEAYYPSWQVSIDGKSAEVEKVDGMFRGVKLPAGDHQVTFTFVSQSLKIGQLVTAGGLLLLLGALLASTVLKENFWKRG